MIEMHAVAEAARQCGIVQIGAAPAGPLESTRRELENHPSRQWVRENFSDSRQIEKACSPGDFLPGAKTVLAALQPYLTDEPDDLSAPEDPHGKIAPYTRRNYYRELRTKLKKLSRLMKNQWGGACYIASNGFLREKPFALAAGLGGYGKNGVILNSRYGSWIILGLLITDLEIAPQEICAAPCRSCGLCRQACPTGAIGENGLVHPEKCLQKAGETGRYGSEIFPLWGTRLYGCTDCQKVCPVNRETPLRGDIPPWGDIGPSVSLKSLIFLDDEAIRERFRGNQLGASWVSPQALVKNALAALANSKTETAELLLRKFTRQGRPALRDFAAQAIRYRKNPTGF